MSESPSTGECTIKAISLYLAFDGGLAQSSAAKKPCQSLFSALICGSTDKSPFLWRTKTNPSLSQTRSSCDHRIKMVFPPLPPPECVLTTLPNRLLPSARRMRKKSLSLRGMPAWPPDQSHCLRTDLREKTALKKVSEGIFEYV